MSAAKQYPARHLGRPGTQLLDMWARTIAEAWGRTPLVVGSSLRSKQWRDVDVRLVLPDAEYEALTGSMYPVPHNHRVEVLNAAFSLWAQQVTGLPVDFQFQSHTEAVTYDGPALPMIPTAHDVEWDKEHFRYEFPETNESEST